MRIGDSFNSPRLGVVTVVAYCGAGTYDVRAANGKFYRVSGMPMLVK